MELHFTKREEWREWLKNNHASVRETWLVFYKKPSGKPRIPYNDAVEEALCFGWIDGKLKRVNDDYYIQRFTPRRRGSTWSELNISRVRKMISEGLMMKPGLDAFLEYLDNPSLLTVRNTEVKDIPDALIKELKKNKKAFDNFYNFPVSTRKIYLQWLTNAKREETISRRIGKIIELAEKNIKTSMF
ncbi:MAG: YdeI/OmpD-associated family protein [Bacteroidales bacterium]